MTTGLPGLLALGFVLGMRHATDADHVVAVTATLSRERGLAGALRVGALWGVGHTVTILLVGGAIILLGAEIPPRLGLALEMAVAVMLIVLGIANLRSRAQPGRADAPPHASPPGRRRALLIGAVHGLAGSAAVALLVLTTVDGVAWSLIYLGVFGSGTVLGMMLLTAVMTAPLAAAARRIAAIERLAARLAGAISLPFGLFLVYRFGVVEGLFSRSPHWTPG